MDTKDFRNDVVTNYRTIKYNVAFNTEEIQLRA